MSTTAKQIDRFPQITWRSENITLRTRDFKQARPATVFRRFTNVWYVRQ